MANPSKKDVRAAKEARTAVTKKRKEERAKRRQDYFAACAENLVGRQAVIAGETGTITELFYKKEFEGAPAEIKDMKGRVFEITMQDGRRFYRSRRRLNLA